MPAAEKAFSETYHTVFTVEYWGGGGGGWGYNRAGRDIKFLKNIDKFFI